MKHRHQIVGQARRFRRFACGSPRQAPSTGPPAGPVTLAPPATSPVPESIFTMSLQQGRKPSRLACTAAYTFFIALGAAAAGRAITMRRPAAKENSSCKTLSKMPAAGRGIFCRASARLPAASRLCGCGVFRHRPAPRPGRAWFWRRACPAIMLGQPPLQVQRPADISDCPAIRILCCQDIDKGGHGLACRLCAAICAGLARRKIAACAGRRTGLYACRSKYCSGKYCPCRESGAWPCGRITRPAITP